MDEILLTNVSSLVVPSNKSDKKNAIKNGGNDDDDDENDEEEEEVNNNKELFIAHVVSNNRFALDLLRAFPVLVPSTQIRTPHITFLVGWLTTFLFFLSLFLVRYLIHLYKDGSE